MPVGNHTVSLSGKSMGGTLFSETWSFTVLPPTGPARADNDKPNIDKQSPSGVVLLSLFTPTISARFADAASGIDVGSIKLWLNDKEVSAQAQVEMAVDGQSGVIKYTVPNSAPLPVGIHKVTLQVKDKNGTIPYTGSSNGLPAGPNMAEANWQFAVAVPPSISNLSPKDITLPAGTTSPIISASFAGNTPPAAPIDLASVKFFIDGIDLSSQAQISADGVSYTPSASSPLNPGPHLVVLIASNTAYGIAQVVWGFEIDTVSLYQIKLDEVSEVTTTKLSETELRINVQSNKSHATKITVTGFNANNIASTAPAYFKTVIPAVNPPINTTTTPDTYDALPSFQYVAKVKLSPGNNDLTITAEFADGQKRTLKQVIYHDAPPQIHFTTPTDFSTFGPLNLGSNTPGGSLNLSGVVERPVTITGSVSKVVPKVMINQQSAVLTVIGSGQNQTTQFTFSNFFLHEGVNLLTAIATDAEGQTGTTSITLYVDQTAPLLTVEAPVNTATFVPTFGGIATTNKPAQLYPQAITSQAKLDIRGVVNDAVEAGVRAPYPSVTVTHAVTGQTTQALVSDRFFIAQDVPLILGQNILTVTATDWVGNSRSQSIAVSRINVGSSRLSLAGGNRQRGPSNTELPTPLSITASDKQGNPIANLAIAFEVIRGTGTLNPGISLTADNSQSNSNTVGGGKLPKSISAKTDGINLARALTIRTDKHGKASVWYTLGRQAGEAANMVKASLANPEINMTSNAITAITGPITEEVIFTATALRGQPKTILLEGGGSQYAETRGQALDPLSVVVYDGDNNPIPGAIVGFRVEPSEDAATAVFESSISNNNVQALSTVTNAKQNLFLTQADNNGRAVARPLMGDKAGIVRVSA
jgi:hypothetical protein